MLEELKLDFLASIVGGSCNNRKASEPQKELVIKILINCKNWILDFSEVGGY